MNSWVVLLYMFIMFNHAYTNKICVKLQSFLLAYFYSDDDTKWLEWIEVKFKDIAGDDGEISRDEFKVALGVKKV